jgi:hypothetical protein
LPYEGTEFVFDDARMTASEARLQKNASGGMSPAEAERRRYLLDPDAWVGALLIAMRRSGRADVKADDLDLDALELTAIVSATEAENRDALAKQAEQDAATDDSAEATTRQLDDVQTAAADSADQPDPHSTAAARRSRTRS